MVFKIAIVGAGPAGCMLARLLLQSDQGISVAVLEGEGSLDFRSQGGTLDLHEKTGQKALRAAGLYDEFKKYARYDGEAMKLADKKLLCYLTQGASKEGSITGRPEIDRPQLRELLYDSLPAGTVRWNKKLTQVDDKLNLRFADGSVEKGFDLVVGADGAWSKVRTLVSDVKPFYSGIAGHAFSIPDAQENHPELYDLVNRGSLFAFSDSKSIMAQYMSNGSLSIATWSVRDSDWQQTCGYDVHDPIAVKEACRKDYADWDPRLLAYTQAADDDFAPRDLYMLPIGHKWDHVPGVTLIGDAAHVMTPFAGEGVNLAFQDCLKLSQAIIAAAASRSADLALRQSPEQQNIGRPTQLDLNVRDFERDMFKRATKTQQMTYDMMEAMYKVPGAPRNGIERYLITAVEGELGRALTLALTPVVYIWYFIFKLIW